jgi:MFS transporter, NNP family, nitrate/nitrite transporter
MNAAPAREKIVSMESTGERRRGSGRNLALATAAFGLCFAAWSMLAPLAPKVQDKLGLSDTETAVMLAIPVVLGSLLRIPLGWFVDRIGARVVFTGMLAYSGAPG